MVCVSLFDFSLHKWVHYTSKATFIIMKEAIRHRAGTDTSTPTRTQSKSALGQGGIGLSESTDSCTDSCTDHCTGGVRYYGRGFIF